MAVFDAEKVQGNILRGYPLDRVRHMILEVSDRRRAREFLAVAADGAGEDVPRITRSANWSERPEVCFNIGITFEGLRTLGLPSDELKTFPTEYTVARSNWEISARAPPSIGPRHSTGQTVSTSSRPPMPTRTIILTISRRRSPRSLPFSEHATGVTCRTERSFSGTGTGFRSPV